MSESRAGFGSKLGLILATAGSAVGLGNVWRFPYMTGTDGGAVFILIYFFCILFLGIPCMVSEFIIGRHGASNTARAYAKMAPKGSLWRWVGFLGVATGFLITGYYAVVAGWCLQYMYASAANQLQGDHAAIASYFTDFSASAFLPVFWTAIILLFTHYVIIHGVRGGIEKASKMFMPTLFVLLLVIVVSSCMLPGAGKGISFLFHPDFSKLNSNVFLDALGQSFYSLSIAMGCITYASYFSRQTNLLKSAVQISIIDSVVAILAGLMIFPAAFSVGVSPDSGPSLIFITLPHVFQQAFSGVPVLGYVLSLLFYALLSLAAITSLISLHEVSTAFFYEELHLTRKKAAAIVTGGTLTVGLFCSLSLGAMSSLSIAGHSLFDVFDFVTGQIFLPIGGFLTCIFLGWVVPRNVVKDEFTNWGTLRSTLFGAYIFSVRYVCPLSILAIFLHQLGVF